MKESKENLGVWWHYSQDMPGEVCALYSSGRKVPGHFT